MKRMSSWFLGLAAVVGLTLAAGPVQARHGHCGQSDGSPSVVFGEAELLADLQGETWCSGDTLSAAVEMEVLSASELVLRVTNTSPAAGCGQGPYLERLGFNLADGPPLRCLALDGDDFALKGAGAVCAGPGCHGSKRFDYRLVERVHHARGLDSGASAVAVLRIKPRCQEDFSFSADMVLEADQSRAGLGWGQWGARFVSGPFWRCGGLCTNGCAAGDATLLEPPTPPVPVDYAWLSLMANAVQKVGSPSLYATSDTRAGSALLAFNGGLGFDGLSTDPPYGAAEATLRNGAGTIVEQIQVNRRWPPSSLDSEGCSLSAPWQCWIWPEEGDTSIAAALPTRSSGANQDFDDSGERVEVGAELFIDLPDEAPTSATHERARFSWSDPEGLDGNKLLLRLFCPDETLEILRAGYGAQDDFTADFLAVIVDTPTELVVELIVQDAAWYCLGEAEQDEPNVIVQP